MSQLKILYNCMVLTITVVVKWLSTDLNFSFCPDYEKYGMLRPFFQPVYVKNTGYGQNNNYFARKTIFSDLGFDPRFLK